MKELNISQILKGCTPGRIQTVGFMQVIPLISDIVDNDIVTPIGNISASTITYGTLVLQNKSAKSTIFPTAGSVITKQHAQNHSSPKGIFIGGNKTMKTTQACCIQSSQGGAIYPETDFHFSILPFRIRERSTEVKDVQDFRKLWPAIQEFNHEFGLMSSGHLEQYLEKFKDELDNFIAEFEVVKNQVGAIILIDGDIVGVERAPNYEFWKSLWTPLVRECYGSYALKKSKSGNPPKTRIPMASANIKSIADLKNALADTIKKEEERVKKILKSFIDSNFKRIVEQKDGDQVWMETIKNQQFVGQVLHKDGGFPYVSIITTRNWMNNPRVAEWANASDFKL